MISFDIIGSREKAVAIVEIPEEKEKKEIEIAKRIMKKHKNVKSVLKKTSERKGTFRLRELKLITGEENTEVLHVESGCKFKLDPKKVYFSPREGTERLRISGMAKPEETILVMFAGVGPFPIIIAKKQPLIRKIIAVEINPEAYRYMVENVRLNKVAHKVIPLLGDVREECKDWYGKCDRVIMPLPHEAEDFLDIAIRCLKKKGVIHLYVIEREEKITERAKNIIKKMKKKVEYRVRKILPYAPRTNKYCLDIFF